MSPQEHFLKGLKVTFEDIPVGLRIGVYRISGRPDNPAPNLRFAVYPDPAGS